MPCADPEILTVVGKTDADQCHNHFPIGPLVAQWKSQVTSLAEDVVAVAGQEHGTRGARKLVRVGAQGPGSKLGVWIPPERGESLRPRGHRSADPRSHKGLMVVPCGVPPTSADARPRTRACHPKESGT